MSYMEREWLDEALQIGMTPDEFWYGDPELFYNYARAYENKQKQEQQNIWQIGARVKQALSSSILMACLADKNTARNLPDYPECPYLESTENGEQQLTDKQIELERQRAKVWLENWVNSFKKQ